MSAPIIPNSTLLGGHTERSMSANLPAQHIHAPKSHNVMKGLGGEKEPKVFSQLQRIGGGMSARERPDVPVLSSTSGVTPGTNKYVKFVTHPPNDDIMVYNPPLKREIRHTK